MPEGYIATKPRWWHNLWWWIRGVGAKDYRRLCGRCGCTGQAHYALRPYRFCWRFREETPHQEALRIQAHDPWGRQHPDFPREDWRYEVANNDTQLGYWEWVEHQIENERDDARED